LFVDLIFCCFLFDCSQLSNSRTLQLSLFAANGIGDDGKLALADAAAVHPITFGECFVLLSEF
jgi:hypothetical protein